MKVKVVQIPVGTKVKVNSEPFNNVYGKETMDKLVWTITKARILSDTLTSYTVVCPEYKGGVSMAFLNTELEIIGE